MSVSVAIRLGSGIFTGAMFVFMLVAVNHGIGRDIGLAWDGAWSAGSFIVAGMAIERRRTHKV
jgi:hypothetical protein